MSRVHRFLKSKSRSVIFRLWEIQIFSLVFLCLLLTISVTANIPIISYLVVNDTTQIRSNEIDNFSFLKDTLKLGQLDKLEIHLNRTSINENQSISFQINSFEKQKSTTKYPYIRYTNIPEGLHELQLWQGKDTLKLNILCNRSEPLFFMSDLIKEPIQSIWWFQPLLTFCLLLIPFTIVYFLTLDRSRRNLRVEVVRNQIASDLHDDVGVNLSAIKNLTEVFIRKNKAQLNGTTSKIINRIKTYTDETLNKLQDTVWAINPRHDTIEELVAKMKDFATTMIPAKGMKLTFIDNYNTEIEQKLDMPQRHSMFLMYKEAVNNIIKHSNAKSVEIRIGNTQKTIDIAIKDDGDGFDTRKEFAGNGLKNFQNRATDNFIDFDLKSKVGEGTAINMVVYSL